MTKETKNTIVIFGATGGLGVAIAKKIASSQKNNLILIGRQREKLNALHKDLSDAHADSILIESIISDLTMQEEIDYACSEIIKKHNKIDWIIYSNGHIDTEEEQKGFFLKTFLVNTFSIFSSYTNLKKYISPTGGIVIISSTAAQKGNGKFPFYAASKAALHTYALSEAKKNAYEKILAKIVILTIGPTNTPMRDRVAGDATEHQSPAIIAETICNILFSDTIQNGTHIRIENEKIITEQLI